MTVKQKPMIQAVDVWKSFGNLDVLKGIDMEVYPGEVACLIGPSGSGKSTLLRCVCLLYTSPSPRDRTRSRMPSSA